MKPTVVPGAGVPSTTRLGANPPLPHDANRSRLDDGQRINRLLAEHQRVEGIAVVAKGSRDEAIIRWIVHRAVQHAVQPQKAGLFVQFVFVLAALGDLDNDRKGSVEDSVVNVAVVPRMHAALAAQFADGKIFRDAPLHVVQSFVVGIEHFARVDGIQTVVRPFAP